MAVMYALACMVEDGTFKTADEKQKWTAWLDEWAEWVMHGLPSKLKRIPLACPPGSVLTHLPNLVGTPEGGFQHIVYNNVNHFQLWDDTLMMTGQSGGVRR
jgi:unsaturated rhamnogalacturonyl hydrolase